MPLTRRHHHHTTTTTTTTPRPYRRSIFSRRTPRVVHHQRKPTLKDKVSGALTKLKGSLTHRPGVKVRNLPQPDKIKQQNKVQWLIM